MIDRRYPTGRYTPPETLTDADLAGWIDRIASFPARFREAAESLSVERLDSPYREDGWTRRQVVHHVADSHANAYIRFKLALTEAAPRITPYDEAAWAELADTRLPIAVSLALIDALHTRWAEVLRGCSRADLDRPYTHPHDGVVPLARALGLYAWHGDHHLAHLLLED